MLRFAEADTNVWTDEMKSGFFAALPSAENGDRIAARVAFLEVYRREVERARAQGKPVQWQASLGWDKQGREDALRAAIDRGYLTHESACHYLPHLRSAETTSNPRLENEVKRLVENMGAGHE